MGYPDIFDLTRQAGVEQNFMLMTFEAASWVVAIVALLAVVSTAVGIFHLVRSESGRKTATLDGHSVIPFPAVPRRVASQRNPIFINYQERQGIESPGKPR